MYNYWKIDGKGYICLEKSSFLDLEPSIMIHADSLSFLTFAGDPIQKYSVMFGFSWTNPSADSQWYIKNVCSHVASKGPIYHDLGL